MSEASPNGSPPGPAHEAPRTGEGADLARGLPMVSASDPAALVREKAELAELSGKGAVARWRGYFTKTGPGWMQSAVTLGGGSAMASLFAGAYLKYELLWVQPVAMVLGVVMLAAMARQTLCTNARPFGAMKQFIHPSLAWAWAIASLAATIIWHFPQYALAAGMTEDMIKAATGRELAGAAQTAALIGLGVIFLVVSTAITWSYGSGRRGVRLYERVLKAFVWMIVLAFAVVVVRSSVAGRLDWTRVARGFLPLSIPTDPKGFSVVMGALGAAVGINMTFLFPYTLLARHWGREHRGLAKFDLITGMLIPYCLATSLMVIAAGCTIHDRFDPATMKLTPVIAASMIEAAGVGAVFSRFIFGLGILGMALSTITVHMLISGFAACEILGIEPTGWRYRLACLIPAPGVFGVVLWKYMGSWIAVPTSAICGLLLPIAYVGFFILNNSRRYLGDDRPAGAKRLAWNIAMLAAIGVVVASGAYYVYVQRGFFGLG